MIETCLAVFLISLIFCGVVQISQIFAAREVLQYAAARGARAKTVGFNKWMVYKSINVAAIPNSGKMLVPSLRNADPLLGQLSPGDAWSSALSTWPSSDQYAIEKARIPDYLDSKNSGRADFILNYENWEDGDNQITHNVSSIAGSDPSTSIIQGETRQEYPLWVPLHEAFYADDAIALKADAYIENHYPLYINDLDW